MNPAPLQLEGYFVTEVRFAANAGFDQQPNVVLRFEDFQVGVDCRPMEAQGWRVHLNLQYEPDMAADVPCHFRLGVLGVFRVAEDYPAEMAERLVRVNGPSILYGVSREIARNITSMGPIPSLALPAVSFFQPAETATKEQEPEPRSTGQAKTGRGKSRVRKKAR